MRCPESQVKKVFQSVSYTVDKLSETAFRIDFWVAIGDADELFQ